MITVNFKQKCGLLISYKVDGHAEYGIDNEIIYDDVVCGVVSNLAQVVILGVTEVLHINVSYVAQEGDIRLDMSSLSNDEITSAQVLMETMLLGLKNLEISYGEYIKVLIEEVQ